ncbi:MAG: uracil-DNA glycosylase [Legionella sp.]|nr:uracil-DNA glycosylase [Legionella sp.]
MSNEINQYYLQQMGIDLWTERSIHSCESKLSQLAMTVSNCVSCPLHQSRTQTVFSRGNPEAALMIIGEAPGLYEDEQGLPFVGKAGDLLNQMLLSIGLAEQDVYITNVTKCKTPENRPPAAEEMAQCGNYLSRQIDLVAPKLLLALGDFAGQFLARRTMPLNQLRTSLHYYNETPYYVSYHPEHLLGNPVDKKQAYADLLQVKKMLLNNL